MSKKVLILGAGMVARPVVTYFHEQTPYQLTIADQIGSKARELGSDPQRIHALELDMSDEQRVKAEISRADLVISLLPFTLHPKVAELCLDHKKHLVTASYESADMRELEPKVKSAGIVILNEIGLDPGLDHMEAMRIIHEIKEKEGFIRGFTSWCGGLPAPEANDNPLGYKFSWSPLGVLMAGKNPARFLRDGQEVSQKSQDFFRNPVPVDIPGIGTLEGYPNRDSIPYIQIYGIETTNSMFRGTLRYSGWCSFIWAAQGLGLLDGEVLSWEGHTYRSFMRRILQVEEGQTIPDVIMDRLGLSVESEAIRSMEWLGLWNEDPIPLASGTALDVIALRLQEKLQFSEGERDMIALQHIFDAEYPNGEKERIVSTLIDYGIPYGDSAMSRTVGYPTAIAARLILEGRFSNPGIHIPVDPAMYIPILEELEKFDISFTTHKSP